MKPICLTLEGLHSFREKQTIRFDELSDAGVFGIFGPTGSGKSTILDAITLALYGSVGRANHGTQGILNHAEKKLEVSFQFQIGQGTDRKTYRIDRRYARNEEMTVKNTYSRLVELDANDEPLAVLADKSSEVTERIEFILGLKKDDFSKAVVLPQGKFQEFLHLDGSKRRQILQRLFGLEQYGMVLSSRLKERLQAATLKQNGIHGELEGLGDASEEALETAKQQLDQAIAAEHQAAQALELLQTQFQQAKEIVGWQKQLTDIQQQLLQHAADLPRITSLEEAIGKSERAQQVIPYVERLEGSEAQQREMEALLTASQASAQSLLQQEQQATLELQIAVQNKEEQMPVLISEQTRLTGALELEAEYQKLMQARAQVRAEHDRHLQEYKLVLEKIEALTLRKKEQSASADEQKKRIEENTVTPAYRNLVSDAKQKDDTYIGTLKNVDKARSEFTKRTDELQRFQGEFARQQQAWKTVSGELAKQEHLVTELSAHPPVDEESLAELEIHYERCRGQVDQLLRIESDISEQSQKLAAFEDELVHLGSSHAAAAEQLKSTQQQLLDKRDQYQEAMLKNKQALAVRLAEDLCTGKECPVCGSVEHPHPVTASTISDNSGELQEIENAMQELEKFTETLSAREKGLSTLTASQNATVNGIRESLNKLTDAARTLKQTLAETLGLDSNTGSAKQYLAVLKDETNRLLRRKLELKQWKETVNSVSAKVSQLKEAQANQGAAVAVCEQKIATAQAELEKAAAALTDEQNLAQQADKTLQSALQLLGVHNIETALQALEEKDYQASNAQSMLNELQKALAAIDSDLQAELDKESIRKVKAAELASKLQGLTESMQEKQEKLNKITQGLPAKELAEAVNLKLQRIVDTEKDKKAAHTSITAALSDENHRLTELKTQFNGLVQQAQTLRVELERQMSEHQFVTIGEVRDAILPQDELSAKKQEVQNYYKLGNTLEDRKLQVEARLNNQHVSEQDWLQIQADLDNAVQAKNNTTLALGAFKAQYLDLQDKHQRWTQLKQRADQLAKELGYLNLLREILKGDRFVEFLAQEQLSLVARQASERLKKLTRNRYALEVGEDGGFMMRDDQNGGVRRPVTSLSGGETFLTSLALALSLSTQIQLRGKYPLEFFFLDEGFGTLDSELLDVVMSTLEQLHLEKMTIGVISHVPELQQRLHRKLIVEPAEAAGRGSRVRIERL